MFLFQRHVLGRNLKHFASNGKLNNVINIKRYQTTKEIEETKSTMPMVENTDLFQTERIKRDILPSARILPMIVDEKDATVMPFDEVPGPKALKYAAACRYYLSELGTQLIAGALTLSLNIGSYFNEGKFHNYKFSSLFDEYGPVVRFVNPVGTDIVLLNHPAHIQKVFSLEGEYPNRSTLESLQKFRTERRSHSYSGIYNDQSHEWSRRKSDLQVPSEAVLVKQARGISEVCHRFTNKLYTIRNYQDEVSKDLYEEIRKWAFDTMGLIMFSKNFSMLDTEVISSQCDVSWMYHSLVHATDAILKCEGGLHLWKLFGTPAWYNLVKHCDNLDSLLGKFVLETEQNILQEVYDSESSSLAGSILLADKNLNTGDVATILMDMMLIGVNTVASSMSFLLFYLAKHQRVQKILYNEIKNSVHDAVDTTVRDLKSKTPYLQACIKETLRLTPPIPIITRILPKNIILDHYNIPRGTMIIMVTQNASTKESYFDDASKFYPERWLQAEALEQFACIPFGFGVRKCLGQNMAEAMLSLLTIQILQKYKLEYHYGDVSATKDFITRPKQPLKIRFIDRIQ
ncbi:1,25-dihydroxyvitamin D(3) 24-hydroxylase, mitochondrial-like [Aricia agestis]|uniref:1,25-dihydroxyvitamin D(3) 24-hydroxylase, mitochondrial-like n=1 Tax=Aricia agestis TaxID=91739 RepID=UPI001C209A92|nr:1,25-dihydroxyvitamin D(3) 24-hydroxylase, mitochondrial-like [Aricia agestis]